MTARSEAVAAVAEAPLEAGRFLRIRDEDVWVGELCLDQLVAFIHFARRLVENVDAQVLLNLLVKGQLQAQQRGANGLLLSDEELRAGIDLGLRLLTKEQVHEFVAILVDRPTEWVAEKANGQQRITTSVLRQIIGTIQQYNDLGEVLAVFQKAWLGILSRLSTVSSSGPQFASAA